MIIAICFLIIAISFYFKSKKNLFNQFIYENFAYITGITSFICFAFTLLETNYEKNLYYLILIPIFIFLINFIKKETTSPSLNIQANQQRYFDEVDGEAIYAFYKNRKVIKPNRVEVLVNEESKKLIKHGYIVPEFFLNYKNMELTKVEKLEEIENYELYNVIFKKVQGFIKQQEININYEARLKENNNCLEFFLLDLWESYTSRFNIGVANLDILAKNEKEIDFLGAVDLIHLNCIKRKGAVTYYKYLEFKDRIKEYLKDNINENPTNDEVFDESYALENDSDKTEYKG
ncbi:hypothetical protein CDJ58_03740 [Campylobacter lari]|nr:hypothetical protein [Campylobacter lari]EAK5748511.1 hypothetical protein [Campylobacter lari]EAK9878168.1 hypothetical protein [Campylobacter lari]